LSATTNNFRKATEDVKAARAEIAAMESAEAGKRAQTKAAWETEKESLQITIKKLQKALAEREKLAVELSTAVETDMKAEMTPLKAQNETLSFDKLALKQQLQMAASLYGKKEKNLQQQLDKYKRLSEQLKERRASTGSDYAPDSGRLYALLMTVEEYDRQIREKLEKVGVFMEKLVGKMEGTEGKMEARERYEGKGKRLDELIGKIGSLQAFPRLEMLAGVVNDQTKAYESALEELKLKIGEAVETIATAFTQEIKDFKGQNDQLSALISENQTLQTALDAFSSLSEQQFALREELQKTQQELEHAKATILSYMESISALEEVIAKEKAEGEGEEMNAEAEKLRIEVARLTQENANLSAMKSKAEEMYEANMAQFRGILEAKSTENETLKANLIREKTHNSDQIKAFSNKLDSALLTLEATLDTAKTELTRILQAFPATAELQKACSDLQSESIAVLKSQISEREALLEETRAKWKEELSDPAESIWKDLLEDAETHSKTLSGLNKTLGDLLHTLTQLAETMNNQIDQKTPRDTGVTAEVETLRAQLAAKQQEYEEEIALVRSQAEAEVRSVKNMEASLTTEITALRAKLRDSKKPR
jgi:hypothetical protein